LTISPALSPPVASWRWAHPTMASYLIIPRIGPLDHVAPVSDSPAPALDPRWISSVSGLHNSSRRNITSTRSWFHPETARINAGRLQSNRIEFLSDTCRAALNMVRHMVSSRHSSSHISYLTSSVSAVCTDPALPGDFRAPKGI
jgi:hypothetical protein